MVKTCGHEGCLKQPTFGIDGSKNKEFCGPHAKPGMVCIHGRRCGEKGCMKVPSYGAAGTKTALYCRQHAKAGMVAVRRRTCTYPACTKSAIFGAVGSKNGLFCSAHKEPNMIDVVSKRCGHPERCDKHVSYGVAGSGKPEFCSRHARTGMVNVLFRRCGHPGCTKRASCAAAGTNKPEVCWEHSKDGMVNIIPRKRCAAPDCMKAPSYATAGTRQREYCRNHAKDGMVSVKQKCEHPICSTTASYGERGSKPEFCAKHKNMKPGLIDVRRKTCIQDWCTATSVYGVAGSRIPRFCSRHAAEGMVNLDRKSKSCGQVKVYTPTPILAPPEQSPVEVEESKEAKDKALLKAKHFLQEQQQHLEQRQRREQQRPQLERQRDEPSVAETPHVLGGRGDSVAQREVLPGTGRPFQGALSPHGMGIQQAGALPAGQGFVQRWHQIQFLNQVGNATASSALVAPGGRICRPQGAMMCWATPAGMSWMRCAKCGQAGHSPVQCPRKGFAFSHVAGSSSLNLVYGMSPSTASMSSQGLGMMPAQARGGGGSGGGGCHMPPPSFIPSSHISHAVGSGMPEERQAWHPFGVDHIALSAGDEPTAPTGAPPSNGEGSANKRARTATNASQEVPASPTTVTPTASAAAGVATASPRAIPGEELPAGNCSSPEAISPSATLEDGWRVKQEYKEGEQAVPVVKQEEREEQRPAHFAKRGNLRNFC